MNQKEFNAFFEDWKARVSTENKDGPGEDIKECDFNAFFENWKANVSHANKDGPGEDRKETDNDAPEVIEVVADGPVEEAKSNNETDHFIEDWLYHIDDEGKEVE
jgi:hypothetical protein